VALPAEIVPLAGVAAGPVAIAAHLALQVLQESFGSGDILLKVGDGSVKLLGGQSHFLFNYI
jgi:hypothetical protein